MSPEDQSFLELKAELTITRCAVMSILVNFPNIADRLREDFKGGVQLRAFDAAILMQDAPPVEHMAYTRKVMQQFALEWVQNIDKLVP